MREVVMSTEAPDRQQQKVREFMSMLPLTLAIAGLPTSEAGKPLTESQMESRATTVRTAYKVARQLIMEVARPSEG
jgi:hypothetical protein